MDDPKLVRRVRETYESCLRSGEDERRAIDAALTTWRELRPDDPIETARDRVTTIVAEARLEARMGRSIRDLLREFKH